MTLSRLLWASLGALTIGFHLALIFSGLVSPLVARPIHMALALPWALVLGAKTPTQRLSGVVLTVLGVLGCAYIALNDSVLSDQYGSLEGDLQYAVAFLLIGIVLEMARRCIVGHAHCRCTGLLYVLRSASAREFGHPGIPVSSF